jgi:hypothetical protein
VVGDTLGFDKSTISRVVDSVTDALVARKDQHIKWPMKIHQLNIIKEGFYKKAHFPNDQQGLLSTLSRLASSDGNNEAGSGVSK